MFSGVLAMRMDHRGAGTVWLRDGRTVELSTDEPESPPASGIAHYTLLLSLSRLVCATTRGDEIDVELPRPDGLSPLRGRPAIYLDQNHWSTLTNALHHPGRVGNKEELDAAVDLIDRARRGTVVLPRSAAHMTETCQQIDAKERYFRALTIAQLSAGWQLRHPLEVRRDELLAAFHDRYHGRELAQRDVVTLEPRAALPRPSRQQPEGSDELPAGARWLNDVMCAVGGDLETLFDDEHVPMVPVPGWAPQFQEFALFLASDPTGPEMKRRRTHAKFIVDLGRELAEAAHQAGISPKEMSDWALRHSEQDLRLMPALGLYREVMHEKLCDPQLAWEQNDLVDMIFLTVAAGYCDHVVGERSHASHMKNGLRRMGRDNTVHRTLRSLMAGL